MFNEILVPTDFSPPSEAAIEYARAVAKQFDATLHLLHVVADPYRAAYSVEAYVPVIEGLSDELIRQACDKLQGLLRSSDMRDLHATADAVIGTPAWSIVDYAHAHDIDLIVMGTHGHGGVSHLLMGSVAEKVVRTAMCPVLTVRQTPVMAREKTEGETAAEFPPGLVATSSADAQC